MQPVVIIHKPLGATPLETITAWKKAHAVEENISVGYAGRLDPMAEGVLVVLVGDENKKRKDYERLTKTYEVEIVFGITTDSYDTLGIIKSVRSINSIGSIKGNVEHLLKDFKGTFEQAYPPFSAARVKGKPLFYYAREGTLDTISIPSKNVTITDIAIVSTHPIRGSDIVREAIRRTHLVHGAFRQEDIKDCWEEFETKYADTVFTRITVSISCSGGTYMRSIAHVLGRKLGVGAIAYRILRIAAGPYTLAQAEKVSLLK